MTKPQAQDIAIGSDAALTDPAYDAFGYAPFAQRIADAVSKTPSPQGLVMAIHGPWGSGKSTLLNFVKYYLAQLSKDVQPIVIEFNPWWFDSREHLAIQFLSQFRAKLPHESEVLRTIGDKMAEYGNAIGAVIAGTYGIPWLDRPIGFVLKFLKKKPKDVPTLKAEISKGLANAGQRFVFVVDDIDRLAPDEIRELFKVIKALADFPNVIYLLSFDRKVVAEALHTSLGIEGEAYLEKIVQAPFSLPAVDRLRLRQKLFSELDRILEAFPLRNFDQTYWGNVYFGGLDHYVGKPRDIVRVANTLSVTYPAVAGEVNPTDFVALEFLRVFEPEVYGVIRDHRDMFVGHSDRGSRQDHDPERTFHDTWLNQVPAARRAYVKDLLLHLFPRLESIWGNMHYGSDSLAVWRKELRVCCPDTFDVYFQFGVASDALRRAELEELIAAETQIDRAVEILTSASTIKRPDGTSKAREYLDRLHDLQEEITPEVAAGLLDALFEVGDMLLSPQDEQGGMTTIPNQWRMMWTVNHLLNRIPSGERNASLLSVSTNGKAVGLIAYIITVIESHLAKTDKPRDTPLSHVDTETVKELRSILLTRLSNLDQQQFLTIPDLDYVIHHWIKWVGKEIVAGKIRPLVESDTQLPALLEKYLRFGTRHGWGDRVSRRIPGLNPKHLEPITNISSLEPRVEQMLRRTDLTSGQRTAGEQFLKSMERIRQGKEPDGFFTDD
jgi:predicted KAP-like P-loop ATPase